MAQGHRDKPINKLAMDWNIILDILKWLIPVGGFGSIAGWFINRTERELKRIRESHDAYKVMYEDLRETVKEDINEKKKLRTTIGRLERALSRMYGCRYFPNCPVNIELQHQQTDHPKPKPGSSRQPRNKGDSGSEAGNSAGVESETRDTGDEPP